MLLQLHLGVSFLLHQGFLFGLKLLHPCDDLWKVGFRLLREQRVHLAGQGYSRDFNSGYHGPCCVHCGIHPIHYASLCYLYQNIQNTTQPSTYMYLLGINSTSPRRRQAVQCSSCSLVKVGTRAETCASCACFRGSPGQ